MATPAPSTNKEPYTPKVERPKFNRPIPYEKLDPDAIINNHPPPPLPKKKTVFDPNLGKSGATWGQIKEKDGNIVSTVEQNADVPPPVQQNEQKEQNKP